MGGRHQEALSESEAGVEGSGLHGCRVEDGRLPGWGPRGPSHNKILVGGGVLTEHVPRWNGEEESRVALTSPVCPPGRWGRRQVRGRGEGWRGASARYRAHIIEGLFMPQESPTAGLKILPVSIMVLQCPRGHKVARIPFPFPFARPSSLPTPAAGSQAEIFQGL